MNWERRNAVKDYLHSSSTANILFSQSKVKTKIILLVENYDFMDIETHLTINDLNIKSSDAFL